jgi:PAS domain S-box-containing protein
MFRKHYRESIRYKFLKDISIILFASTCVLSTVIAINEGKMLKHSLMTKGQSILSTIAKLSEDPLIMKDSIQLDATINEAKKDEDIIYIIFQDAQKNIITSQYASINYQSPRLKVMLSGLSKESELPDIIAAIKKKAAITELSLPILTGTDTIGTVTICMSQHNIRKQIVKTIFFVIALNLVVTFVLGSMLFIVSKKTILDPIIELGHAATRLAKGDLSTQVKIKATGEIQMLVNSFNQMAENLEKTTVSKDYVNNIIKSMIDTLIVASPEGEIIRFNSAACLLLGYEERELIGQPLRMIIYEEFGKDSVLNDVTKNGFIGNIEKTYLSKDGRKIPVLFSASAMRDKNDDCIQGIVCVAQDITDRKRAEEALLNAAQQWRTTFDGISDIVCLLDREGRILRCNKAMMNLLEKPLSEIIGRSHCEIVHGTTAPIKECPVELLRETRCRETTTLLIDDRWFNVAVDPLLDEAGGLIGAVHIMSDVTDHKRAEKALRESEDRYRDLVEYSQYLILTHNLEGQILSVNQGGAKILGYEQRDLLNKKIPDLLPIEIRNEFDTYLDTIRKDGVAKGLMLVHTASGEKRIWEYNNTLRTEGVTAPIVRSIAHDVTDRLRAEKAVKGLSQENAIMAEIGRIISSTLNIEEVYERFAKEVRKLFPIDRILVNIVNPKNHTITVAYVFGVEVAGRKQGDAIPYNDPFIEELIIRRSNVLIQTEDDNELAEGYPILLNTFRAGLRSMMSIPLISKDQVIGLLHFRSTKPNAYTETDLRLAEKVGNQIAGAIANAQLFAERKRIEEELRENEKRLQALMDASPLGISWADTEGNIKYCNPKFSEYFGYTLEDIPTVTEWRRLAYSNQFLREKLPILFVDLAEAHKQGKLGKVKELIITCKDGSTRCVEGALTFTSDRVLSTYNDLTERKKAEELLKESEEEARQLAHENAIMAEIGRIISSTLNIEDVYERFTEKVHDLIPFDWCAITTINHKDNRVCARYISGVEVPGIRVGKTVPLSGTVAEEILQSRSGFLIQMKDEKEVIKRLPRLLPTFQAGFRSMISVPLFSKDEVIGILHLRSRKLDDYSERDLRLAEKVGNQIAGAIANAQLFAERKRAEEERSALQEQLRQSQKMEAVGKLAGGVAHDFNNLLTVIHGYSELILNSLDQNSRLRQDVLEIMHASERASSLTNQLLAFSRKQVLQPKVLDLNVHVSNMDKMLRRMIGEDIELVSLLAKDLGRIKADPGQIEQVILNLAINAKDAMPNGGKLTIETANVLLDESYARSRIGVIPGRYVMLSVSDTGSGMTPEIKERIFEPFFTTKEKGKGTGLGLSTVYGIIQQSGGDVWVYSEPGVGTTFKIYLPTIEEGTKPLRPTAVPTKSTQGFETILLVEDEEMVRKLACTVLQKNGYTVLEASNGEEALRIVQGQNGNPIHLMVTDVVMPGMSGRQLAERLLPLRPEMKVLYMSGYTDDAIVHHGVLDPGIAYIQKPFAPDAFASKVREILDI